MKITYSRKTRLLLSAVSLLLACAFAAAIPSPASALGNAVETPTREDLSREGYALEQVVVFSRHNIRSPFGDGGLTPHTWVEWTSEPTELTVRGGALETLMGRYFRLWLEKEGLFPENYRPGKDEVRVYANSVQRTIATARYFTVSLLPAADVKVETHMKYGHEDPVFSHNLTFASKKYTAAAAAQAFERFGDGIGALEDNAALLYDVLDIEGSKAWKKGRVSAFRTDDTKLTLRRNASPVMKGSLQNVYVAADSLVLQYYEQPDPVKAAFGRELTFEQWVQLGDIKVVYSDLMWSAPLIGVNAAHPLLQEIESELTAEGRRFTFLCGHDANICSLLGALGAEDYLLPYTIERKTPVGGKMVFCRWSDPQGNKWITVDFVYQTADQIRNLTLLDLEEHPAVVPMRFSGLAATGDGLYAERDFLALLDGAVAAYDGLKETYTDAS